MAELDAQSAVARPRHTSNFSEVSRGYTTFRNSDILVAKITPCWENGKVGQARLEHAVGVGSTEFHVLRPRADLDARYLLHFLRQPAIRAAGELQMTGSGGQKRVPAAFLGQLRLRRPPVEEQRRIAAILDQADTVRTKQRRILKSIDSLEQSLFYHTFGDPSDWQAKWPMGIIGDLAESIQYGTSMKPQPSGALPLLRMGNVTDDGRLDLRDLKYIDLAPSEVQKYSARRGDLLFNRTNSKEKVGKAAVVHTDEPLAFAGYLVRVRLHPDSRAEFISSYLGSQHGLAVRRRLAKAAVNQANISASEMRRIPIALPPNALQVQFADHLAAVRAQRANVERLLTVDDALFASLQSRAFQGEL